MLTSSPNCHKISPMYEKSVLSSDFPCLELTVEALSWSSVNYTQRLNNRVNNPIANFYRSQLFTFTVLISHFIGYISDFRIVIEGKHITIGKDRR